MKLISQIGGYEKEPARTSPILKGLRSAGRRIPWGTVAWVLFAAATLLIALKAVSLLAGAVKAVSSAS